MSDTWEKIANRARAALPARLRGVERESWLDGADWGYRAGLDDAERELRAPGPCGIAGHTMADWHGGVIPVDPANPDYSPGWCAACRRERELGEILQAFVNIASREEGDPIDEVQLVLHLVERAERLLSNKVKA